MPSRWTEAGEAGEVAEPECEGLDQTACGTTSGCAFLEGECQADETEAGEAGEAAEPECEGLDQTTCGTTSGCAFLEGECQADETEAGEAGEAAETTCEGLTTDACGTATGCAWSTVENECEAIDLKKSRSASLSTTFDHYVLLAGAFLLSLWLLPSASKLIQKTQRSDEIDLDTLSREVFHYESLA